MIPRKKLDIGWSDLAFGAWRCLRPWGDADAQARLERLWSPSGDALACLSVRSGFDLLLQALALPTGAEVLVSAVTIRDMVRIIEEHGLVAVPVDLDMRTLSVKALAGSIGPRARAIVIAHLFGSRMPMEPVVRAAREHGLLVVEDCAQAYAADGYRGHPESDVSLFSFGPIKTASALGGALLRVRDPVLLAGMRARQSGYPRQGRREYLRRVLKYAGLKLLSGELAYGLFAAACRLARSSHDRIIGNAVRGFAGAGLFAGIRRQPASPLLAVLERRLRQARPGAVAARAAAAKSLAARLAGVGRPGEAAPLHTHWVFPVHSASPDALTAQLWRRGFDATRGATSLYVVPPPEGRIQLAAREAERVMRGVVYLPAHPGIPQAELGRLAREVAEFEARSIGAHGGETARRAA